MLKFFKKRAEARRREALGSGYEWAAGELLRAHRRDDLDATRLKLATYADNRFDRTPFDDGIENAMDDFDALYPKKETPPAPKCCVCGTTKGLHFAGWHGHRCSSDDCLPF